MFDCILKIIRNLNVSKAHGHDDTSIWMLKIRDSEVVETLSLINDKHIIKNYHPVSLVPICGRIFECIL